MVDPPTTLESGALMSCVVGNSRITLQLAPCTPSTFYRGFLIHSQPPLDAVVLGVCVCVCVCVHTQSCPLGTPWTVARQAPLSVGLCRQEHWSGGPCPPPGDPPDPGAEPESPASLHEQEGSLPPRHWQSSQQ